MKVADKEWFAADVDADADAVADEEADGDGSYIMVECSNDRKSNTLIDPSFPTDANTLVDLCKNLTSNTSES